MFLPLFQCQNNDSIFQLSGEIKGQNIKHVIIIYETVDDQGKMRDTIDLIDGKFKFSAKIRTPTIISLYLDSPLNDDPNYFQFFAEPNKMSVFLEENKFKTAKVIGSKTQQESEYLDELTKNEYEKLTQLSLKRNRILEGSKDNDIDSIGKSQLVNIKKEWTRHQAKIRDIRIKYIASMPSTFLGPYYLSAYYFKSMPLDTIKNLYNNFSENVKESYYGSYLNSMIESAETPLKVGDNLVDFSLVDLNNQLIDLKSFKDKYIILDFWASWCGPCRKEAPKLVDFYKKHKEKGVEIIGLSSDSNKNSWLNAIKEDDTNIWHHVFLDKNSYGIKQKYDIEFLPTYILIDPEGIIKGKYSNFDDLENSLMQMFND